MDQAILDYLLEVGALQPEQEDIQRKRAIANQLRQRGMQMPEMGYTPGGNGQPRIAVRSSPLEFLASLANAGLGAYRERQADEAQTAYGQKRRDALGRARTRLMPSGNPSTQDPDDATRPY